MKKVICLIALLLIIAITACAEEKPAFSVLTYQGGPLPNANDDAQYINNFVNDSTCPVEIINGTLRLDGHSRGRIQGYYRCRALVPVSAFEVRITVYNIFREHLATLNAVGYKELDAKQYFISPELVWHVPHEHISEYTTTIFFIAKVLTKDGQVWKYHPKRLAEFNSCNHEDLEVTADPPRVAE